MRLIIVRILTPFVLCCFICAFLELDFGGHYEQTWHDEYDVYTLVAKVSCPESQSYSFVYPADLGLPTWNSLFFANVWILEDIATGLRPGLKDSKVFLKYKVLLI